MILNLVSGDNPILKQKCEQFDFDNPPMDPKQLVQDLKDSLVQHRGIGLSACQVGIPYRVFVVGNPNDPENIRAFFNPKVVDAPSETVLMEEGCLSYPGLFMKVKRPSLCRVRYADETGNVVTAVYDDVPARAILHEMDHMDGITFHTRANPYHREQAQRQKKKLDKLRKANKERLQAKLSNV